MPEQFKAEAGKTYKDTAGRTYTAPEQMGVAEGWLSSDFKPVTDGSLTLPETPPVDGALPITNQNQPLYATNIDMSQFGESEEQRNARYAALEAQRTRRIEQAKELGQAAEGGVSGRFAKGSRSGVGYDSIKDTQIRAIQKETMKTIDGINAEIEEAKVKGDWEAEERAMKKMELALKIKDQAETAALQQAQLKLTALTTEASIRESEYNIASKIPKGEKVTIGGKTYTGIGTGESETIGTVKDGVWEKVGGQWTQVIAPPANGDEKTMVVDIAGKYPDAGILPTDTLEVATSKLKSSKIYQQATRLAGGGSGSGGNLGKPSAAFNKWYSDSFGQLADPNDKKVQEEWKRWVQTGKNVTSAGTISRAPIIGTNGQIGYQTIDNKTGEVKNYNIDGSPMTGMLPVGSSLGTFASGNPDTEGDITFDDI